jgi:predicted  nucleic acid-binding Zn-ribbon protein
MTTANPDDKTHPADAARERYEEYKKKIEQHLSDLGKQMDTLKDLLSKAAVDAKVSIEHEMEKLKKEHAGEFERLSKLRAEGENGLHHLGARLDKLVEDITAAVTSALGIKKQAEPSPSAAEPTKRTEPAAAPPAAAAASDETKD